MKLPDHAYNVIESLAHQKIYFDLYTQNKTLGFLKPNGFHWEMYYAGWHILDIQPDLIEFVWNGVDILVSDIAYDLLNYAVITHMAKDESYQYINNFSDLE